MSDSSAAIYDPRLGQDFRFSARGGTFSSLQHRFYVIDDAGTLDWSKGTGLLKECVLKTSMLGFFTVAPWVPGARQLAGEIKREFRVASEFGGTLCGYFDIESDSIQGLLEIRKTLGDFASGEWGLGGCLEEFSPPTRESSAKWGAWGLPHLLSQPAKLGCLLYLGELHQTTFLTRTFDGLDSSLDCLGVRPAITSAARLGDLVDFIHDWWFDAEQIFLDKERKTVAIHLERRKSDRSKGSKDGIKLVIGNAVALSVKDTEKVRYYDLDEIRFDAAGGLLLITGGIPITIEIKVTALRIEVERAST